MRIRKSERNKKTGRRLLAALLVFCCFLCGCYNPFRETTDGSSCISSESGAAESCTKENRETDGTAAVPAPETTDIPETLDEESALPDEDPQTASADSGNISFSVPEYSGEPYAVINNNIPFFTEDEITAEEFENYPPLDELGRCGAAFANISLSTLPEEERGLIGDVRPSGWQTVKYEGIDGNYLYNRCHLIAYCLAGENANERNLITGTRYLNVIGMLPFELQVLDYTVKNRCHVLYRATPVFAGEELVARGVLIEALSAEDGGKGFSLCVYCFNVQPGIEIDYATGDSVQREVIYMPGVSGS